MGREKEFFALLSLDCILCAVRSSFSLPLGVIGKIFSVIVSLPGRLLHHFSFKK